MSYNSALSPHPVTEITTLIHGGSGLGRAPDGRAVFIPYTVPGDQVRYRVRREYKRYIKADLVEVLRPSTARVAAPCPYFGTCGGCDWQMLDYADQCEWKQHLLHQNLEHNLGEDAGRFLDTLLPAPADAGYRCRAQFKCAEVDNTFLLGFFRPGTHEVVDTGYCPVLHPHLNALLDPLRQLLQNTRYAASVSQIDAGVGDDGRVRLLFRCRAADLKRFAAWLKRQVSAWDAAILVLKDASAERMPEIVRVQGDENLAFCPGNDRLQLEYSALDFCQVNLNQNRVLVAQVLKLAAVDVHTTVYDLYCGVGNFAVPMALHAGLVVGVEANAGAIGRAKENARSHGLENTRFYAADVRRFLTRQDTGLPDPDVVVLDPPRAGAKQVVGRLGSSGAKRIVYVSCDQHTMLRDIRALIRTGYELRFMRGVDMFPHTHHCEVVALLVRV